MRRWILLSFLCLSLLFLSTSCQTKVVTEYVPMEIDLTDVVCPVLQQRPDNSKVKVIEDIQTLEDIVQNSAAYMYAWEVWESYADALEQTIIGIRDELKPKSDT